MAAAESGDAQLWRELIEQQLRRQPTNVTHWFNLAIALSRLGDVDAAAATFDIANRLQPDSIAILLNRGICQLDRRQPKLAEQDFTACLKLAPKLMVPRFNRSLALFQLGAHQAALADLNQLVLSGQTTTRILLMRAQVHDAVGDANAAQADRLAARQVEPRDVNDWVALGVSRLAESPQEALADFQSALKIRADDVHALRNIAHVYAERLNQPEQAIEALTRLVRIHPESASAVASRGILFARTGNHAAAIEDANSASKLSPGAVEQLQITGIYAMVSQTMDKDDYRNEAFKWLARALKSDAGLAQLARADTDLAALRADSRFGRLISNAMTLEAHSK